MWGIYFSELDFHLLSLSMHWRRYNKKTVDSTHLFLSILRRLARPLSTSYAFVSMTVTMTVAVVRINILSIALNYYYSVQPFSCCFNCNTSWTYKDSLWKKMVWKKRYIHIISRRTFSPTWYLVTLDTYSTYISSKAITWIFCHKLFSFSDGLQPASSLVFTWERSCCGNDQSLFPLL